MLRISIKISRGNMRILSITFGVLMHYEDIQRLCYYEADTSNDEDGSHT